MSHILRRFRRSIRDGSEVDEPLPRRTSSNSISSPTASSTVEEGNAIPAQEKQGEEEYEKEKKEKGGDMAKVEVIAAQQNDGEIKYRTMSWKKCAAILFGEYVCLAILSFPWAFKTLGE